jgi:hypothetical protein
MANGISTNSRITFTMFSDAQVVTFNISSASSGSNQIGEIINVPVGSWVYLNTSSLSDIRWASFVNEGSLNDSGSAASLGSIAVKVSGSSTNLTYLHQMKDGAFISMQSGSNPKLIATSYTSASFLNYKLQES